LLMIVLSDTAMAVKLGSAMSDRDMKGGENSRISDEMLSLMIVPDTLTQ
jgi:hypothetical protein